MLGGSAPLPKAPSVDAAGRPASPDEAALSGGRPWHGRPGTRPARPGAESAVPRRLPDGRTREAKRGRGEGVFGAGPGPELLTASCGPATGPGAAIGHLRGLFGPDIFVLQRAVPATAGPGTLLVRDSAVSAAEARIANARRPRPARARSWTFRAIQRQPASGCRPVVSVPRRGPAQTWVWRKQPRRHPSGSPPAAPRPGRGSGMCWAEGSVASLSLRLSGKPRRAGPHLHLTAIAPEARTDGDIAWPGARTGVGTIARWDLGREPTPQSRPDMKAPRELRRGAFLPEPQCPHS